MREEGFQRRWRTWWVDGRGWRVWMAVFLLLASRAGAVCNQNICCSGSNCTTSDPCTISADQSLDPDCELDFGTRSVTIANGVTIQSSVTAGGYFAISGGSITLRGRLFAPAGEIDVTTSGNFKADKATGAANSGRIDVTGVDADGNGGLIEITVGGDIDILNTSFLTADHGGTIDVCAGTRNAQDICTGSPNNSTITINSSGVSGTPAITASDGGGIVIVGKTVSIGANGVVSANGDFGTPTITTLGGNLTVTGTVRANAIANADTAGLIILNAAAGGAVNVSGTVRCESASANLGTDGEIDISACSSTISGTLDATGPADDGVIDVAYRSSMSATSAASCTADQFTVDCRSTSPGACVSAPSLSANCTGTINYDDTMGSCSGCGNGLIEGSESCDDGNISNCDQCTADCHVTLDHCNDGLACTADSCAADGKTCNNVSTCNDNNVCTTDTCSHTTGACVFTNNSASCSDGNACTTGDVCSGGSCHGTAVNCDDSNGCTTDSCNTTTGACVHTNNTLGCNDGNACTVNDFCSGGTCHAGSARTCNDNNVCTTDGCDPATGCTFVANSLSCDDGNPCTAFDVCYQGTCQSLSAAVCDDGNPCTRDTCSPSTACAHDDIGCTYQFVTSVTLPSSSTPSLATVGSRVIIGDPGAYVGSVVGAGQVFVLNSSLATERVIVNPSPGTDDAFGYAVSAAGSNLAIGVPGDPSAGSIYLYNPATGAQTLGPVANPDNQGLFGYSLSSVGNNPLVGSPDYSGTVSQLDAANGSRLTSYIGPHNAYVDYGYSVAGNGSRVAIGAPTNAGAVDLMNPNGSTIGSISAPSGAQGFGYHVDLMSTGTSTPGVAGVPRVLATSYLGAPPHVFDGTTGADLYSMSTANAVEGAAVAGNAALLDYINGVGPELKIRRGSDGSEMFSYTFTGGDTPALVASMGSSVIVTSDTSIYKFSTVCGNGTVDAGEQCDDGNTSDGDCCSSTCQFETSGQACNPANACTVGVCNGSGTCTPGACRAGLRCGVACGNNMTCVANGSSCTCQ